VQGIVGVHASACPPALTRTLMSERLPRQGSATHDLDLNDTLKREIQRGDGAAKSCPCGPSPWNATMHAATNRHAVRSSLTIESLCVCATGHQLLAQRKPVARVLATPDAREQWPTVSRGEPDPGAREWKLGRSLTNSAQGSEVSAGVESTRPGVSAPPDKRESCTQRRANSENRGFA
jgi:hypothetical protein